MVSIQETIAGGQCEIGVPLLVSMASFTLFMGMTNSSLSLTILRNVSLKPQTIPKLLLVTKGVMFSEKGTIHIFDNVLLCHKNKIKLGQNNKLKLKSFA